MASATKIEISPVLLRTLHRIHCQRTDLNSQIERGPRQIKAGDALVADAAAALENAKGILKRHRVASDEKQLQLKTREARIVDLQRKLNVAASNREYTLLQEQIAADRQANAVLSDEIFEQLEQLDVLQQAAVDRAAQWHQQQQEQQQRVAEIQSRLTILDSDLARVVQELATAEAKIPEAVRADYIRLTQARGEEALAPVEQGSCGGCYQTLTTQVINQLQLSQLVLCPNCNAFLYLPEDTRVG